LGLSLFHAELTQEMSEQRKQLADHYLTLAKEITQSTAKLLVAVLAPLALVWLVHIESLRESIDSVVSARSDYKQSKKIVQATKQASQEDSRAKLDEREVIAQ
jgi:hypothetical protein